MAHGYLPVVRDQQYLLPPDMAEWLPADHLAWFLLDVVGQLDLSAFAHRSRADGRGRAAYDPTMLVALVLYAYCVGERSSRQIERRCHEDVAFRVLAANHAPDHTTIARFLQTHADAFGSLFSEVLRLCATAGMVRVGTVVIDGTKMAANASAAKNLSREAIDAQVARILAVGQAVDAAEDERYGDRRGDELPAELADRGSRLERLRAARARLDAEDAARVAEHERRLAERARREAETGRKTRGRRPKPRVVSSARANVTDPDSRVMKAPARFIQGYNAQVAVTADQVIVAADVSQQRNDHDLLAPMIATVTGELDAAGIDAAVEAVVADAGYWSAADAAMTLGPELFIAPAADPRHRPPPIARTGPIPRTATALQRMERKLQTRRGTAIYAVRRRSVEPVFGQIKDARRAGRFRRRGLAAAISEWRLLATTHNLLKLWRNTGPRLAIG